MKIPYIECILFFGVFCCKYSECRFGYNGLVANNEWDIGCLRACINCLVYHGEEFGKENSAVYSCKLCFEYAEMSKSWYGYANGEDYNWG